jgi:hypothetical protein
MRPWNTQFVSPDTPVSSNNKTDCHYITEILLKVALKTLNHNPLEYKTICVLIGCKFDFNE